MSILYGCKLMKITQLDEETGLPPELDPVTAIFETPQQANMAAEFSEGQRQELRGGDRLLAVIEDDPNLVGWNLTFVDAQMGGEALTIIAGGEWDEVEEEYLAPMIGEKRKPFKAELYVARYAEGTQDAGDLIGYRKWTLNYVKGRIPDQNAQDRNFLVPQFTLNCKQNNKAGLRIFSFKDVGVEDLPEVS